MSGPVPLNLMRRRKQQYRLRRRRYVVSNADLFPGGIPAEPNPVVELPPADDPSQTDSERLRKKLRFVEAETAQLQKDLQGVEFIIKDYERRIAEKDAFIDEAKKVLEDAKAQVLRNRQEVDSARRRMQREKDDMKKFAAEETIRVILSPLDHFTLAVEQWKGGGSMESLGEGMVIVYRELMTALEGAGLSPINTPGVVFDPAIHDAVSKIEDKTKPDGEVVKIMRPGFRLNDRVLRPAIVEVNKCPTDLPVLEPVLLPEPAVPEKKVEHADAVRELRPAKKFDKKDAAPINPKLADTHSSPLERARRMLESKFDAEDDKKGMNKK